MVCVKNGPVLNSSPVILQSLLNFNTERLHKILLYTMLQIFGQMELSF